MPAGGEEQGGVWELLNARKQRIRSSHPIYNGKAFVCIRKKLYIPRKLRCHSATLTEESDQGQLHDVERCEDLIEDLQQHWSESEGSAGAVLKEDQPGPSDHS